MNYSYDIICDIINYIQLNCEKNSWNKIRVLINNLPNKSITYKLTCWNKLEEECLNRVFDVSLIEHLIEALFTSVFICVDIIEKPNVDKENALNASQNIETTKTKTTTTTTPPPLNNRRFQYYFIAQSFPDIITLTQIIEKMFPAYISIPYHNIYYDTSRITLCLEKLLLRLENDYKLSERFSNGAGSAGNGIPFNRGIDNEKEDISSFQKPLFIYKTPAAALSTKNDTHFNSLLKPLMAESSSNSSAVNTSNEDDSFTNEDLFSSSFSKKLSINGYPS